MSRLLIAAWLSALAAWLRLMSRPVEIDGQSLDRAEQAMLTLMRFATRMGPPPHVAEIRRAYSRMPSMVGVVPDMRVAASDVAVGGDGPPLTARLYAPPGENGSALLFFHGGGWILGDLDTHDALCRFLAARLGMRVVAVGYRLAPEHIFPAAFDDGLRAFRWLRDTPGLGVDPDRIAIGGDSAGGNLAAAIAVAAVVAGEPGPCATWLLYPALDLVAHPASADLFADGFLLTREMAERCVLAYAPDGTDRSDLRLSPLRAAPDILRRLPPSVVTTAGFDPLRDQGLAWAAALRAAGVRVTATNEAGLVHGFADFAGVISSARTAVERAADALGDILGRARLAA